MIDVTLSECTQPTQCQLFCKSIRSSLAHSSQVPRTKRCRTWHLVLVTLCKIFLLSRAAPRLQYDCPSPRALFFSNCISLVEQDFHTHRASVSYLKYLLAIYKRLTTHLLSKANHTFPTAVSAWMLQGIIFAFDRPQVD